MSSNYIKYEETFGNCYAIITGTTNNRLTIFLTQISKRRKRETNTIIFQADYTGKRWTKLKKLIDQFKNGKVQVSYISLNQRGGENV